MNINQIISSIVDNCDLPLTKKYKLKELPKNAYFVQELYFVDIYDKYDNLVSLVIKRINTHLGDNTFENHYKNEIYSYKYILPCLDVDVQLLFPTMVYSSPISTTCGDTVIVLDDLTTIGYRMSSDTFYLTVDEITIAVRALGLFHGEMYRIKLTQPSKFMELLTNLKPTTNRNKKLSKLLLISKEVAVIRNLENLINDYCNENAILEDKAKRLLKNINSKGLNTIECEIDKTDDTSFILCHGDFNRNNICFCYDGDKPSGCKILDLQTMIYTSPVRDLAFIFFMNLHHANDRSKIWSSFMKFYYDAIMERVTKYINIDDVPEYLKLEELKKVFKNRCFIGFTRACMFTVMSTQKAEVIVNFFYEQWKQKDLKKERLMKTATLDLFDYTFIKNYFDSVETLEMKNFMYELAADYLTNFYD